MRTCAAVRISALSLCIVLGLLCGACGYARFDVHPHQDRVQVVSEECRQRLGHAKEREFMQCVVDGLLQEQAAAKAEQRTDYFPVVPHEFPVYAPSRAHSGDPGYHQSELLKDLLRNYSCDVADGGSQPVRSITWEYQPSDPCETSGEDKPMFTHKPGFLPAGNDLALGDGQPITQATAEAMCLASAECKGFTFMSPTTGPKVKQHVYFKTRAEDANAASGAEGWHTYKRRTISVDCRKGFRPPPPSKIRLRVDVLQERPPVYIVHDFAKASECEHMMNLTIPRMTPSVVYGGGAAGQSSTYRQSYSVNMYPDYDDDANVITRMVRRKFAFARDVAEYDGLWEGEGQEPLNSVYYKDDGDQYRPHCDGQCHGGSYRRGERIATSLTYCAVADRGGYTMFSRTGLKVVPKLRSMLFFGYKHNPLEDGGRPTMDNGFTEHTGCPLREGSKWIATMWYREGMTAEKDWTHYRTA